VGKEPFNSGIIAHSGYCKELIRLSSPLSASAFQNLGLGPFLVILKIASSFIGFKFLNVHDLNPLIIAIEDSPTCGCNLPT
jgi:hypothetical protein